MTARSILFLQGVATRFFSKLGQTLAARGHKVHRINFCGGDRLFWSLPGAVDYRGGAGHWPNFLSQKLSAWGVSDLVLFGDCRPIHIEAIKLAKAHDICVHVFEEGYLRPNWVTLEEGGVNAKSSLPRDPGWYLAAATDAAAWDGGKPVANSFARRAVDDVLYHVARVALSWRYPHYRTHLAVDPFLEYAGWLRRFAILPVERARAASQFHALLESGKSYYLFPLQLDGDSQVRFHSPYASVETALEHVAASLARHAPANANLVIKRHPLEVGFKNRRSAVWRLAERLQLGDRLVYLDDGPLETLLGQSLGVVTINSTVGLLGMSLGLPVIVLGSSIYDMPCLTFQHGLDRFWTEGAPPDARVFDAFRRVIGKTAQVNGGFFSREGLAMAVEGAVRRMEATPMRRLPSGAARPDEHREDAPRIEALDVGAGRAALWRRRASRRVADRA